MIKIIIIFILVITCKNASAQKSNVLTSPFTGAYITEIKDKNLRVYSYVKYTSELGPTGFEIIYTLDNKTGAIFQSELCDRKLTIQPSMADSVFKRADTIVVAGKVFICK